MPRAVEWTLSLERKAKMSMLDVAKVMQAGYERHLATCPCASCVFARSDSALARIEWDWGPQTGRAKGWPKGYPQARAR